MPQSFAVDLFAQLVVQLQRRAHAADAVSYTHLYKQIVLYIQLLQDNGTRLSENVTKHLMDGIWELRPGNNRRCV